MTTGEPVVIREQIMSAKQLWTGKNEVLEQLWVFNNWIVIRTTLSNIYFYEKSTLIGGRELEFLPITNGANITGAVQKTFDTIEFGRDENNSSRCFLFGT